MVAIPPYLKTGDTVGILSTARKIDKRSIQPAVKMLEDWGFHVQIGATIGAEYYQFAGMDHLRAKDLQMMMDDPEVKCIYLAKGGYGTIRIIDRLDFTGLVNHPKWIAGFSDVTVLHAHLNNCLNMATLHCHMAGGLSEESISSATINSIHQRLTGHHTTTHLPYHAYNQTGIVEGTLIGGNLSILYNLIGMQEDFDPKGKVLFLEEVDEYLYHVDRMLWALKRTNKFEELKGVLVGGMTDMNDNEIPYGKEAEAILHEHLSNEGIPVAFGFPAGHHKNNQAFYLNQTVKLEVGEGGGKVEY